MENKYHLIHSLIALAGFCILILASFVFAAEPIEIPLDDGYVGYNCYGLGGDAYFYTNIPYSYSGDTVRLRTSVPTNPYGCADPSIEECDYDSSCYVNVTPGQRLDFHVSLYCGYCGDYENETWYVNVDSVGCGDGTCSTSGGETCSSCPSDCGCYSSQCCAPSASGANSKGCVDSGEMASSIHICCSGSTHIGICCTDSQCPSGYKCSSYQCMKESYCGDGICSLSEGENCSTCLYDCGCGSAQCCHPTSSYANSKGCVDGGERISSTYICCSGSKFYGNCCGDSDCSSGYECVSHKCEKGSYCGDGSCQVFEGEDCSNCETDCGCSSYECCAPSSSYAGYDGCVSSGDKTSSSYICCSGDRYYGNCCSDSDCSSGYECSSHTCVKSSYCGDGTCDSNESCSSCSSDCGSCQRCGDGTCSDSETCSSCPSDCGSCDPAKKPNGSDCSKSSECQGGYCVHYYCSSQSTYCGDNYCEGSETCSSCPSDCGGACRDNGKYCDYSYQCKSGNCKNYRCCIKGKTCCLATSNCPSGYYCDESVNRSYCLPGKPNGQLCEKDEYCESGNCDNGICCEWGQDCCREHDDCGSNKYCDDSVDYCKHKSAEGYKCGEHAMCYTGYCDRDTWTCAEKPEGFDEEQAAAERTSETVSVGEVLEGEIILSIPKVIDLKRTEEYSLVISIRNGTNQKIILGDSIQIFNNIPALVDVDSSVLRIFGSKELAPGESVSTEAESTDYLIEECALTAERAGKGEMEFSAVYFVNNKATRLREAATINISSEHVQREEAASSAFGEDMVLAEKREAVDAVSGEVREYTFVEPEDDLLYDGSTNAWQAANNEVQKHFDRLKDDFVGSYDPEIVGFFKTIKELEEAETSQEITEATLRAIAPPAVVAAVDFVSLLDAIDELKKEEQAFLDHFGAVAFTDVPNYNSEGELIGYSRAILKEEDGQLYAVKIGDL